MDKNSKTRADAVRQKAQINRPKKHEKTGFQQMFMPGYNRSNAMLPKRLQYAGIHQKITESISTGPYINHIKIMRIKRRLKAAEYVISPAKIALFMLDDTRQII